MNIDKIAGNILLSILLFSFLTVACSRTKELSSSSVDLKQPEETAVELQTKTQSAQINIPPPDSNEKEFFKIQILATQKYDRAQEEKKILRDYTEKTIFLVLEKNLWKVQIGDFASREEAERERDLLQRLGWADAWLIRYRSSEKQEKTQEQPAADQPSYFTVQLVATSYKTEAENILKNLILLEISNAVVIKDENLWKIQVGRFSNYDEAEKMLNQVKNMGFNDSFITKRNKQLSDINKYIQPASLSKNNTLFDSKLFSSPSSAVRDNSLTVIISGT